MEPIIPHNSRIKTYVFNSQNKWVDRIPVWCSRLIQDEDTKTFDGVFWNTEKFVFQNEKPAKKHALKIYEVHIGIAGIEPCIHTFNDFRVNVLHRIKVLGYNTIQILALAEHAYYGSFGYYHVTNLFAVSSRFGTPEELKMLIDEAHGLGLNVIMNIGHSFNFFYLTKKFKQILISILLD